MPDDKDDGSKWRHRGVGFLIAFFASLIIPVFAGNQVVKTFGEWYEKKNPGPDSKQDLEYNSEGAFWGNAAGSFVAIMLHLAIWGNDVLGFPS